MTFEGDIILYIQKCWYAILYASCQYLSTKKRCLEYQYLAPENHNISSFILPPDNHPKLYAEKRNYEALSNKLGIHLVQYDNIP